MMGDSNPDHILLRNYLLDLEWSPIMFDYWNPIELIRNRKKCKIIHMHWPEAFWRSNYILIYFWKAILFIVIFYFSKGLGYKWVWSAHNVLPHLNVKSDRFERRMRKFVLSKFDHIIGLAYNTKNDLLLAYNFKKSNYSLALHGTYEDAYNVFLDDQFRINNGLPSDKKIILVLDSQARENKGSSFLLESWEKLSDYTDINLLFIGQKTDDIDRLIKKNNFYYIPGRIPNDKLGSLFNSVDFLYLNYQHITTSGLFFLSVTFGLPLIAPNLPFFKLHSTEDTTIFFDYNKKPVDQLNSVIRKIESGWTPNFQRFEKMKKEYSTKKSAEKIAKIYNWLYFEDKTHNPYK